MNRRIFSLFFGAVLFLGLTLTAHAQNSYAFEPQFTESCTGANQAPLDPTNWNSIGEGDYGQLPTYDELEVLNHKCVTTTEVQDDGQGIIKTAVGIETNNQYISYTIAGFSSVSEQSVIWSYLRAGTYGFPDYNLAIYGAPGTNNGFYSVSEFGPCSGAGNCALVTQGLNYQWPTGSFTFHVGDTITFAVYGGTAHGVEGWFIFQNGTLIATGDLTDAGPGNIITSGQVGIQIDSLGGNSAETAVTNIVAGSFTVSN